MTDKRKPKSLLEREMENAQFRQRFEEEYSVFKLEAQILNALEDKDWAYSDLAKAIGTSKSNISRDLKGGGLVSASLSRVYRIAEALGMRLITLLIPKEHEQRILPEIESMVRASFNAKEITLGVPPSTAINKPEGLNPTINQNWITLTLSVAQLQSSMAEEMFVKAPTLAPQ